MFEALGHYKILERVGAGRMGEVFRARDTRVGRTVAVRVITPSIASDPVLKERFVRDARSCMALSHPSIATLYEVAEDRGALFVASEFTPGDSLRTIGAGRPLNPRRAADLAAQIADGIAEGHGAGIAHGDISSDNVIVTPKGNAKIVDFGLAKWREPAAAPQEVPDGRPFDPEADLLALGGVLYEMLTGKLPVANETISAAQLAPELKAIVNKALTKDAETRYQSAALFSADLREAAVALDARASAPRTTLPATPPRRASPAAPPNPRSSISWALAIVILAGITGAGVAWIERDPIRAVIRGIATRLFR
jgi:serine/threonine protein kinase